MIFNTGVEVLAYICKSGECSSISVRSAEWPVKIPDVCFLDILMPEMDGVSLAEQLREKGYGGHIVFLTTTNDYAVQSYKVKAFSYLLKPPDKNEVIRVIRELENLPKIADTAGILVETKKLSKFLLYKDISYIEVMNHKVYYRLINGDEIEESARISDIAFRLKNDRRFAQCHRSFIVNMGDIYKLQSNNAVMNSGKNIPISRYYADFSNKYI
jgi:DNA-binding LytR/AlgR family response regulator